MAEIWESEEELKLEEAHLKALLKVLSKEQAYREAYIYGYRTACEDAMYTKRIGAMREWISHGEIRGWEPPKPPPKFDDSRLAKPIRVRRCSCCKVRLAGKRSAVCNGCNSESCWHDDMEEDISEYDGDNN